LKSVQVRGYELEKAHIVV